MQKFMKASLAAGAGAFGMGWLGLHAAIAADMQYQGQYEAPPPQAYGPPPAVAYGYPPPPVPYYGPPVYVAVPGPYFGPYWGGYRPRYAYGYGHWGHGFRHW
jgi:hypothetical protein